MRRRAALWNRLWSAARCVALVAWAPLAHAQGEPSSASETAAPAPAADGAEAPEGHWYTRAGCASRSGRTRTRAPRSAPPLAWTRDFAEPLESEPLVWEDRVVVECKLRLYGLDLATGAVLFERATGPQLDRRWQATLYGPALVWRGEGNALECGRWQGRAVQPTQTLAFAAPPRSWLLYEDELYVVTTDALQCYALGDARPRWSARGNYQGEIALLGDRVWVSSHDNARTAYVNAFTRAGGEARGSYLAGVYAEETPHPNAYPTLCVSAEDVLVRHAVPIASTKGTSMWADVDVSAGLAPRTIPILTSPARTGDGWIAFINEPTSRRRSLMRVLVDSDEFYELAAKDHHAEFAQSVVPTSIAGSVACLGGGAFDVASQRALWRIEGGAALRTVPVRDGVLITRTAQQLRAHLGAARRKTEEAAPALAVFPFAPAAAGAAAPGAAAPGAAATGAAAAAPADAKGELVAKAHACFADGSIADGDLRVKLDTGKVWSAALKKTLPLSELEYAEDREGKPLYLRRAADAFAFASAQCDRRAARAHLELATKAATANAHEVARESLRRARSFGAAAKDAEPLDKKLAAIGAKKPGAKALEDLQAKLAALAGERDAELLARFAALPPSLPAAARQPWLRAVLALRPEHAEAHAEVRAALPDGLATADAFDARAWLDFAATNPRATLKTIEVPAGAAPKVDTPAWGLALARKVNPENRRRWRTDVAGVGTDQLYILSSMQDPEALRACWSMSELVSQCLDKMFGGARGGELAARPLELRLYASRSEYISHGFERAGEAWRGLAWTAGHYDPSQNITHVYFPDDAPHEAVLPVFAHEVVHHWIQARCPTFEHLEGLARSLDRDGYWVVEGFANMVEEFDWDLEGRTWSSPSRQADSPSIVARLESTALWPWPQITGVSQIEFKRVQQRKVAEITAPNWLGKASSISNINVFYAQAGTLSSYLYHADGARLRPRLIEYLTTYYKGQTDGSSFERIFGETAATLGEKATQWARELTETSAK